MEGKPGYQEFSLVAANFQCNGCWAKFGSRDQGAATACRHLYCITCIQEIVQSDDSNCPICAKVRQSCRVPRKGSRAAPPVAAAEAGAACPFCAQPISKSNAKAVKTMLEDSDFQVGNSNKGRKHPSLAEQRKGLVQPPLDAPRAPPPAADPGWADARGHHEGGRGGDGLLCAAACLQQSLRAGVHCSAGS